MPFVVENPITALPPQPQIPGNNPAYTEQFNQYVEAQQSAAGEYMQRYVDAMRQQGISVTVSENPDVGAGSPIGVPQQYVVTLSRDGITTTALLSTGRMQQATPEELANFDQEFNLKYAGKIQSPEGQLPSSWYAPPSSPGPVPTVQTNVSLQPQQTAPTPNGGTVITPPSSPTPAPTLTTTPPPATGTAPRYNFWQWNWYYEQETSRVGPDPLEVGVTDPTALITRAEWWTKVQAWYNGGVPPVTTAPPAGGGAPPTGGTGGTGGTPPTGGTGGTGGAGMSDKDRAALVLGAGMLLAKLLS